MKAITQIGLVISVIILILAFGCKDSKSLAFISSSAPTKAQLEKSKFIKIFSELDSLPEYQRQNYLQSFLINYPNSPIIEDSSIAIFYWYGKASMVLMNGDIQYGWARPDTMNIISLGGENFFYRIYSLPDDARIDYQFIIDGKTITDPRNPITTPSGYGEHSQCAMPLFKTKAVREYRPGIEHGTVDSLLFQSKQTSLQPRMLKIYTPIGYEYLSKLPTLYVNDGFKAIEYCSYINILDNLIANKKIKPIIVVFIDFVEGDQEYFISKTDEYLTAICDEMIPLVDKNYKASVKPEERVLSGISAGAHISLLTVFKRSDRFLNAAGQSPTITKQLFDALKEINLNEKKHKTFRFYFDVGRYDLLSGAFDNQTYLYANQLLDKEMTKLDIIHSFNIYNDGHEWANWRERVGEVLIYFFSK